MVGEGFEGRHETPCVFPLGERGLHQSSGSQGAAARPLSAISDRNGLLDRYFYFAMSLLVAVITVFGFSFTINATPFWRFEAHTVTVIVPLLCPRPRRMDLCPNKGFASTSDLP